MDPWPTHLSATMSHVLRCAAMCVLFLAQLCRGADPLDTWTWRNPVPTGESFVSITYGNGVFAAVVGGAVGPAIYTSPDGIDWTASCWRTNGNFSSITYGNGLFLATRFDYSEDKAEILSSADGVNWSQHIIVPQNGPSALYEAPSAIIYANSLYVAVGSGFARQCSGSSYAVVLTSADLMNWTQTILTECESILLDISYGGGKFVAVGGSGKFFTSSDGYSWFRTYSSTSTFRDITYGNGVFIAVSQDSGTIVTSPDGVNWTQRSLAPTLTSVHLYDISYASGLFVAVGSAFDPVQRSYVGLIVSSQDGVNWTIRYSGANNWGLYAVAYGNARFTVGGDHGLNFTSPDGINWTQRNSAVTTAEFRAVAFGDGQFVAVGSATVTSPDGVYWTWRNSNASLLGVTYGNGKFVTVGEYGLIYTSPDGVNWTWRNSSVGFRLYDIVYANGLFVAVGAGGILTSPDGVNWSLRNAGAITSANGVTYGNGLFVATCFTTNFGSPGAVATSPDATNWTVRISGLNFASAYQHVHACYGNGLFVVSPNYGVLFTSPDGINWTTRNLGINIILFASAYGNGTFVASGGNGSSVIITSSDGINWRQRFYNLGFELWGVAYGNSQFIAVGQVGTILESGDGMPQAPTIITAPQSQTVRAGGKVLFAVTDIGTPPLGYQWRKNGQNLAGQTATSLSLTNVQFANAGGYSVIVTNGYGAATSTVAQLTVYTNLALTQTNRAPTTNEIGKSTIPTDPTHFKVYTNGTFQSGVALDPNKMTVVITHGWNSSSTDWPRYMAQIIGHRIGASTVNFVAWDWTAEAQSEWYGLGGIAAKTPGQGTALGTNLVAALGANYSQRIHFIGHSLGTLVNGHAADYVHAHGFSWTNTQMTLCDEAEIAWEFTSTGWQSATTLPSVLGPAISTLSTLWGNSSTPQRYWDRPLPRQFAWADNYISAVGLLHTDAANAVLTYT